MKKYLMNKNVEHNGKMYLKGAEIKEGDLGFNDIVNKGHADVFDFSEKIVVAKSEEQSEQPEQPKGKSKR